MLMTGSTLCLNWVYGKLNGVGQFKEEARRGPAGIRKTK